jgi:AraC family transcriptional regulator of adaptative response/methylated-DNA-[protein]-cysteine methyltransferase
VSFFASPSEAERAGYRACLRCNPVGESAQRAAVEKACAYVREHIDETIELSDLAAAAGVSRFHLIRVFRKALGVAPLAYVRSLRHERLRGELNREAPVLDAIFNAGFGSASRAYDASQKQLGMTPGSYRAKGRGTMIRYTTFDTRLGSVLLAATERGVCCVRLGTREQLETDFRQEFSAATLVQEDASLAPFAVEIREYLEGARHVLDFPIDVRATAFQAKVWEMLRAIPYGETATYTSIAQRLGAPKAVRAVARACATNNVALAIPCHRVIREDGSLAGYRWGLERKRTLLGLEQDHGKDKD